jgi:hypothetical protein
MGHLQPSRSIAVDGSLCSHSCRARRGPIKEALGHIRTLPLREAPGYAEARRLRRSHGTVHSIQLKLTIVVALHIRHKTLHAVCVGACRRTNRAVRTD